MQEKGTLSVLSVKTGKYFCFCPDELPKDCPDGLLIGGGYPELHLKELSENESMRSSVKAAIERGMPSLAECGGFLYLHDTISDKEGKAYLMAGVIHAGCEWQNKLVRFGYLTLTSQTESFLKPGESIRGHEFHYYDSEDNGVSAIARKPVGKRTWECVHADQEHWWGFAHLSYHSNPEFAARFVQRCRDSI